VINVVGADFFGSFSLFSSTLPLGLSDNGSQRIHQVIFQIWISVSSSCFNKYSNAPGTSFLMAPPKIMARSSAGTLAGSFLYVSNMSKGAGENILMFAVDAQRDNGRPQLDILRRNHLFSRPTPGAQTAFE
jgi:hypothetical protein